MSRVLRKGQLHQDSQLGAGLSPRGFHRAAPLSQNLKELLATTDPARAGHISPPKSRQARVWSLSWARGGHVHPDVTEFNCCLLALQGRNLCLKAQSLFLELSFSRLSWCESLMELHWWIIAEMQNWVWCRTSSQSVFCLLSVPSWNVKNCIARLHMWFSCRTLPHKA